jgi:flavodoxin
MGSQQPRHRTRTPRLLVCFYSMTGNTRRLAQEVQRATGARLEELREPWPRRGLVGVIRALFDGMTRRLPPVLPVNHDPAELDLLIVGGPIWAGRVAAPVRSYMARDGHRAHRVAFFCTEGSRGSDMAFADLEALCRRERVASLVVDASHLDTGAHRDALADFAKEVRLALPDVGEASAPAGSVAGIAAGPDTMS